MTYLADEIAGVDPIELYLFTFGAQIWHFTDGDAPFTHPITLDVYTPEMLTREGLQQSDSDASMSVDVTVDARCPIADFFRAPYLPARHISLIIYRTHRGAVYAPAVIFTGHIGQCVFSGATARLSAVPLRHAIGRRIPIQLVQRNCTNTLYDQRCKVVPATYDEVVTITAVNGLIFTVTVPGGHPDGYFNGGFIEMAGLPPASIRDHTGAGAGATFKMLYNPGYVATDVVAAYPGCDGKITTCDAKFNNVPNFQGFPNMPALNPFADEIA